MCGTIDTRTQLPLAQAAQHGCGCCSPAGETRAAARPSTTAGSPAVASGMEYALEGLTCGHCVQTVEKAIAAVPGVESANVTLVAGGTSTLTVTGSAPQEALADAVQTFGYILAGTTS